MWYLTLQKAAWNFEQSCFPNMIMFLFLNVNCVCKRWKMIILNGYKNLRVQSYFKHQILFQWFRELVAHDKWVKHAKLGTKCWCNRILLYCEFFTKCKVKSCKLEWCNKTQHEYFKMLIKIQASFYFSVLDLEMKLIFL